MKNQIQLYIRQSGGFQLADFDGALTFKTTCFDPADPFAVDLGYTFSESLPLTRRNLEILGYDLRLNARYEAKVLVNQIENATGYIVITKRTATTCQFNFVNAAIDNFNVDLPYTVEFDLTEIWGRQINEISNAQPVLTWLHLIEAIHEKTAYRFALADSGKVDLVAYGESNREDITDWKTSINSKWGDPHIFLPRDFYLTVPGDDLLGNLIEKYNELNSTQIKLSSSSVRVSDWFESARIVVSSEKTKTCTPDVIGINAPIAFWMNMGRDAKGSTAQKEVNPFSLFRTKRAYSYNPDNTEEPTNAQKWIENGPTDGPSFEAGKPHKMYVDFYNQRTTAIPELQVKLYADVNAPVLGYNAEWQYSRWTSEAKDVLIESRSFYTNGTVAAINETITILNVLPGEYIELSLQFQNSGGGTLGINPWDPSEIDAWCSVFEPGYEPYYTGDAASTPINISAQIPFQIATVLKEIAELTTSRCVITPNTISFVDLDWTRSDASVHSERFIEGNPSDIKWPYFSVPSEFFEQTETVNSVPTNAAIATPSVSIFTDSEVSATSILSIFTPISIIQYSNEIDAISFNNADIIQDNLVRVLAARTVANPDNATKDYSLYVSTEEWIRANLGQTITKGEDKSTKLKLDDIEGVFLTRAADDAVPTQTIYYYKKNAAFVPTGAELNADGTLKSGGKGTYKTAITDHEINYRVDTTAVSLSRLISSKFSVTVQIGNRGKTYTRDVALPTTPHATWSQFLNDVLSAMNHIITNNHLLIDAVVNVLDLFVTLRKDPDGFVDNMSYYFNIIVYDKERLEFPQLGAWNNGELLEGENRLSAKWPYVNQFGVIKLGDYPPSIITRSTEINCVDFNRPFNQSGSAKTVTGNFYYRLMYPETHDSAYVNKRNKFLSPYQAYQLVGLTAGQWSLNKRIPVPKRKRTPDTAVIQPTNPINPYVLSDGRSSPNITVAGASGAYYSDFILQNYTQFMWVPDTEPDFEVVKPEIEGNIWCRISDVTRALTVRKIYVHVNNQYTYYAPFIMRSVINEYDTEVSDNEITSTNARMKAFNEFLWQNFEGREIETWTLDMSIYEWNRLRLITPILQIRGRDYYLLDMEYNMSDSAAKCRLIRKD